jgi:twitching motility two-component system response regulator PilG
MQQDNSGSTVRMLGYRELLLTLQRLCKEKRTGSMFINDGQGHSAKLVLEEGGIFDVSFKGETGRAAVMLMKEIKQGTASFSTRFGQAQTDRKIDLSTQEIFQILVSAVQPGTTSTPTSPPPAAPPPPAAAPQPTPAQTPTIQDALAQSAVVDKKLTLQIEIPADYQPSEIIQALDFSAVTGMVTVEEQLAAIIGPVARIVYLDYIKDVVTASDVKEINAVLDKIAKRALNPEQQQLFRQGIVTFTKQYSLKTQDTILEALKSSQKKLRLSPNCLALCITKHAGHNELGLALLSKLVVQLEQAGNVGGLVTLLEVLQLIEKSDKTGLLEVREKEKVGGFYFDKGVLINAVQCNMNGKIVAMEMLEWQADYLVFRAVAQQGVSRQIHQTVDVLAKELERLHGGEVIHRITRPQLTKADEIVLIAKAIHLAECYEPAAAELLLCQILTSHDDNFKAWFWLSRVLTNMTAIEIALKKAAHLNQRHPEIAEEVKKFTLARKMVNGDFVLRCPFCWMPTDEQEIECPYCKANFFITPDFFKLVGKAKNDLLDKAIERYSNALQEEQSGKNVYLRFYLAMAYLNRKYYQEGSDQFNEIVKIDSDKNALVMQNRILKDYMNLAGLAVVISEQAVQSAKKSATGQQKILVVEDSMVTRKVIARTLMSSGYEVFEAKNAFEALSDFDVRKPDLVLLDIILPGKDGYEILAEIRQKPMFAKLPIIMLTSRDSLFDKLKGKVSDANEYLTKPFQPDQLLAIVRKYLDK